MIMAKMKNKSDSSKIKDYCSKSECSFKDMVFTTFQYKVCTSCKCEVSESLIADKDREKDLLSRSKDANVADEFDFWAVQNTMPKIILGPDDSDNDDPLDYLGMD